MGPKMISLIGRIPFLPGPLERSSTVLKKIHLIVVQTHVFITATYCFLTKKETFDNAE